MYYNFLLAINAFAEDGAGAGAAPQPVAKGSSWIVIAIYVVLLALMFYFLIIKPNKKRKKEEAEMKNSLCLGVEVVTIGGICGKIVNIKDDEITIQTSIDNTLITFKNWAIREIKKLETN